MEHRISGSRPWLEPRLDGIDRMRWIADKENTTSNHLSVGLGGNRPKKLTGAYSSLKTVPQSQAAPSPW